ncbi:MAG: hypothetical protein LBL99_01485 [Holosporaceae bacterium]|jgi:hypothetical protein|nr:hypothetical protein [Holosporaceae bacterium]
MDYTTPRRAFFAIIKEQAFSLLREERSLTRQSSDTAAAFSSAFRRFAFHNDVEAAIVDAAP